MKLRPKFVAFAPAMVVLSLAASPLYAQDSNTRANQPAAQQPQQQQAQQPQAQQQPRAEAQAQATERTAEKRATPAGGAALTDGQILQIVRTLNDAEIKQAEEAKDEAQSEAVKQVAEMIITDHEASNEQMDEVLEGSLNMEDGDMNEQLADKAEQTHERLQDLSGAEYDCAYLQAQVSQHEEAIMMAKNTLTPAAKDNGVKQFLTAMAPKLEHHMQMAKDAMGQVQGCSAGEESQQSQSQPAQRNQQ